MLVQDNNAQASQPTHAKHKYSCNDYNNNVCRWPNCRFSHLCSHCVAVLHIRHRADIGSRCRADIESNIGPMSSRYRMFAGPLLIMIYGGAVCWSRTTMPRHHSQHTPSINILAMTTITMFVDGQTAGSHIHAPTVELVTLL